MKKILFTIAFTCVSWLFAQGAEKIPVTVELVSGARQQALFMGIVQDTVNLGGNIQGQFTVIRIHKSRFRSIVDEKGNDLLNAAPADVPAAVSPVANPEQTPEQAVVQTENTPVPGQTATDSAAVQPTAESVASEEPAQPVQEVSAAETVPESSSAMGFLDSLKGKDVFVAVEQRVGRPLLASQLNSLMVQYLNESGSPVAFVSRKNFETCTEVNCIKDTLRNHGIRIAFIGSIGLVADSISVQVTRYNLMQTKNETDRVVQMNLYDKASVGDILSANKMKNFLMELEGKSTEPPSANADGILKSYVYVETNPEGANLATSAHGEVCRTPCTFVTRDTSKLELYAYWNVDNKLWAAKKVIKPMLFDTTKTSLKLEPSYPQIQIQTNPSGAEIFIGQEPLMVQSKSLARTPCNLFVNDPGTTTIQIRREGYKDTVMSVFVSPVEKTFLNVDLAPLASENDFFAQKEWIRKRNMRFAGHVLMGASIAPIIAGAIVSYMASVNYSDADEIKEDLNRHVSAGGAKYQELKDENHDLVKKGDQKMVVGGSLIGAGLLMLGVGFVLTF